MRLGAKILKNVVDVNHWQHSNQAHLAEGQANEVYIQLVDLDWSTKASPEQSSAFPQYPIRYISAATAISVKAVFLDIDDDEEFEITATQPFAGDKSIFKMSLTKDQIPNSGNLLIVVDEDGVEKSIVVQNGITVDLINRGGC